MSSLAAITEGVSRELSTEKRFAFWPALCHKCGRDIWFRFFYGIPLKVRIQMRGFDGIFVDRTICERCPEKKQQAGSPVPSAAPE